jgi:micrococcal nuclease
VYVVRDAEARDRYKRLLAYVYRTADNLFVNLSLVSGGFAVPLSIAPNTAHEKDFVAAAIEAERTNIGLWAQCRR